MVVGQTCERKNLRYPLAKPESTEHPGHLVEWHGKGFAQLLGIGTRMTCRVVVVRSAKERSFAERKGTIILAQCLGSRTFARSQWRRRTEL